MTSDVTLEDLMIQLAKSVFGIHSPTINNGKGLQDGGWKNLFRSYAVKFNQDGWYWRDDLTGAELSDADYLISQMVFSNRALALADELEKTKDITSPEAVAIIRTYVGGDGPRGRYGYQRDFDIGLTALEFLGVKE